MSVTTKQIAERTGLSIPTVGNILGAASARYSEKTRERVMTAVREMGYRPNASARAMRSGRIGCAALVLSRSHSQVLSHIPAGLLDGLDEELSKHNVHLAVSLLTDEELSRDDFVPKVLREYMADGMIVNYTHGITSRMLELIHAHHTPAVWPNAKVDADCVYPDNRAGATAATNALIAAGHRRIAMVHLISPKIHPGQSFEEARSTFHYSVIDRTQGFCEAMTEAGLTPRITYHDRFVADPEMIETCRGLLSGDDRPTAVLLYSANEGASVVFAATQLGLSIPRDLTVLQFAPSAETIAGIRLPAVPVPIAEMGRHAVRMLMRKIQSPDELCAPEAVPYGPIPADAIAPPPPQKSSPQKTSPEKHRPE